MKFFLIEIFLDFTTLWNVSSGVLIYEDVHSDESERTEEDDILVSVDIREERTNNEISSSSEEEECRIKELEIEENSEGQIIDLGKLG